MNRFSLFYRSVLGTAAILALFLCAPPLFSLQIPPDGTCFVYPAPATGDWAWAVYNMPESGSAQIDVFNEAGDLVTEETVASAAGIQQTAIDLTHYSRGIYICRVVLALDSGATQGLKIFKFIVIK